MKTALAYSALFLGLAAPGLADQDSDPGNPIRFSVRVIEGSEGVAGGVNVVRPAPESGLQVHFAQAQSSDNLAYRLEAGAILLEGVLPGGAASTSGLCYGDGDGDGRLDALAANQHGEDNVLHPGDGSDAFIIPGGDNYHCTWADADGDGRQEAYLFDAQGVNHVIVSTEAGFEIADAPDRFPWTAETLPSGGGSFGDIDGDGDPDLIVTNPMGPDRVYINSGGRFTRASDECDLAGDPGMSAGASLGDFDNDGDPDLFISRLDAADRLFRNDGGCFSRVDSPALDANVFQSWSGLWMDMDRDGDLDLAVAQFNGPVQIYENRDAELIAGPALLAISEAGNGSRASGLAAVDIDGDGDEDIVAAIWDGLANVILVNETPAEAEAILVNVMNRANAPLYGAQVHASIDGRIQYRELSGSQGLRSQSAPVLMLHAGETGAIDWLEVRYRDNVLYQQEGNAPASITAAPQAD